MDPERKYSNPTKVFYPLEVEAEGCNAVNTPLGPYWEDNRYRKMQIPPTDEFTVETASGVTEIL